MKTPIRLALFAGSPVYYQAPLYRRLAVDPRLDFTAIFASNQGASRPFANEYDEPVDWGVNPVAGYRSIFLKKANRNPTGGMVFDLRDPDIVSEIWRGRYDILWLHGYHTVTHVLAAVTQKARRKPLLYREDQTLLNSRPRWKSILKSIGLRGLFHNAYGLFVGTENQRWFEHWGIPRKRLFHVPYAVDNDALRAAARELTPQRHKLRAELGIERDAGPVILTVGRLISKKQPLHLLEAYRHVRAKRRCALLIVGSGRLETELRQKVVTDGIPNVVFTGFLDQTQVARAYASADVFALVSRNDETWGLVVNEAMNFGLPVVVSDKVGCAADLVMPGRNGFVVPSHDRKALTQALRTLVDSAERRRGFGEASERIIGSWTYDRTAAGVLAAVATAVGPNRWGLAG